ncbi:DNA sulfur modification protein DndD [Bacillus sp. RAR_GA_16]|uniref:DNA sulfur modification protein DndD n=1 Tax=Bacillus sp. RAR_GA_16 TaxID=2876774 RepID=UPI001CCCEC75|nr:DNA sulfur modification protein DndD [Bacillus sp. RAR_GA_16]MCA0172970.1 DNA sulfur modification protein DndD [Bacillus sp. RAR_GA_16]
MLFKNLTIENIGAYQGTYSFDFEIGSPEQNVILIGGENGAGKTTLLNSIKLGLFGSFAYGYKTENKAYYDRIWGYLNNRKRAEEGHRFRVILEYSEVENFKRHTYKLYRGWKISDGAVKEELEIIRDNHHLTDYEKEIYQTRLRETMPPQLFDLCLFDGEEISRIINENLLSNYLKSASKVLFNLDLFEVLESDLKQYVENDLDQNSLSQAEKQLLELQNKEEHLQATHEARIEEIEDKQHYLSTLEDQLQDLKKDFEVNGGLAKEERDKLQNEVNIIETERKENIEAVKEFITTLLPFYLNRSLIQDSLDQMEDEDSNQMYQKLSNRLNDETMSTIMTSVSSDDSKVDSKKLKEGILNEFKPENDKIIHRASFSQRSQVESTHQQLSKENHHFYLDLLKDNQELLAESKKLRDKITANDESKDDFHKIIKEMDSINRKIVDTEYELVQLEQKHSEDQRALTELSDQINDKKKVLKQNEKTQNAFTISSKVMELSKEFRSLQQQKKLQQVQIEATQMLNRLMRKQNYISSLRVNHETYEVVLYDWNKEILYKESLSAGEKEILLLSIIWAMFKCSGRRVPFIFDTLLGRLDKSHKKSVLTDLIPSSGEQVLILSTDTEIDTTHYNLLSKHISHEYTLEFNTEEQRVDLHKEYFKFKESELKL